MGNYTEKSPESYSLTPGGYNLGSVSLADNVSITLGLGMEAVEGADVNVTVGGTLKIIGLPYAYGANKLAWMMGNRDSYFGTYQAATYGISGSVTWGTYTTKVYPPNDMRFLGFPFGTMNIELNELCIAAVEGAIEEVTAASEEAVAAGNKPLAIPQPFDPETQGAYITFIDGNAYKSVLGGKAAIKPSEIRFNNNDLSVHSFKVKESLERVRNIVFTTPPTADAEGNAEGEIGVAPSPSL